MSWTDYSTAPPAGTVVCSADDVNGAITRTVTTPRGEFPVLLVRVGQGIKAYVNACPHQYLPLDYRGNQLLSADGTKLLCTAHGAVFDKEDGAPVAGADCGLDAVPVAVVDDQVVIA
ncbi:Rieske (2Fe-2S) protein [Actibacterium lipolyticum]|uniref:Toluene-4-monooxygenase system ferredoxin subunit n=1 Tax=Actibacterium lipolyticum TaxID=1524263 RepID=A0A238L9N9_9RHOB|nr:Rieske 2Fe-2S domain-containing protein [Actibacterium lipolyticum]SMX51082.1 Toluene-4-monooxygenase system ferredoxin subunit [Actibacterium lipolyticum]